MTRPSHSLCLASGMASWRRWHLSSFMIAEYGFQRRGQKFTLCMTESHFLAGAQGLALGVFLDRDQEASKARGRF